MNRQSLDAIDHHECARNMHTMIDLDKIIKSIACSLVILEGHLDLL